MSKTFATEHLAFYDVDDTLVMWSYDCDIPGEGKTEFKDVYSPYDQKLYLTPHERHLKLLRDHKERGYGIVVWSAGGYRWAEEVVKVLGLEPYVDIIMSKPIVIVDDLKPEQFLTNRVYLKPKGETENE